MNLEQIIFNICIFLLLMRLDCKIRDHIRKDCHDTREVDQADT